MMTIKIRATYRGGVFMPSYPPPLAEGAEVELAMDTTPPPNAGAPPDDAMQFWKSLSLEELAERQGVAEVTNLDEIRGFWPADEDPDEFMRFIRDARAARRMQAEGGGGP